MIFLKMTFLLATTVLVVLTAQICMIHARATDSVASITTGAFYALDSDSGTHRRLHRRDIHSLGRSERHNLRLHLNDDAIPMDMKLTQGSVWDKNSVIVVQRGDRTAQVPHFMDRGCYLYGRVHSHNGTITINRCGRMTGSVRVPGHHYDLEEVVSKQGQEPFHTEFRVTKKRTETEDIGSRDTMAEERNQIAKHIRVTNDRRVIRKKRQALTSVAVETVVYLDGNMVSYLSNQKDMDTPEKITDWIVDKWNTIQSVYGNSDVVGVDVTIQLKKIVIWWENPSAYPEETVSMSDRLRWFCHNTEATDDYDVKMLYTKGNAGAMMGLAYVGSVCKEHSKCSVVRSIDTSVRTELHELGHNLGLPHDPDIGDCGPREGFMAWIDTYDWIPCYTRKFSSELEKRSYDCLFYKDVDETVVTHSYATTTPYFNGC